MTIAYLMKNTLDAARMQANIFKNKLAALEKMPWRRNHATWFAQIRIKQ
jgi:hypothetical protein